jgi:hypothetical protein
MFTTSNRANKAPEPLLRSVEKFYLGITEPLDPYIALSLTNLSMKLVETTYLMGYQDGQQKSKVCPRCVDGKCISPQI